MIELTNVTKTYPDSSGGTAALTNCSLRIEAGEFVAIVGTSGSGKTTLLNLIGCLDNEYTGELRINGTLISQLTDQAVATLRNQEIGFIFQEFNLLDHLTVYENIQLPAHFRHDAAPLPKGRIEQLAERLDIGKKLEQYPAHLSGGQRQRVAIARALLHEPKVLLCDEPTGSLDGKTGRHLLDLFRELHAQGYTIVMITHDEKVAAAAERTLIIEDGKLVANEVHRV